MEAIWKLDQPCGNLADACDLAMEFITGKFGVKNTCMEIILIGLSSCKR